ncbi:MAG: RluA family pseudouridine synthase [Saccharofermentanales bacterium]|jgi:23S rRNA pseudouridine1911/1915/1917 synthase
MRSETLIIQPEESGVRLDKFLALRFPSFSRERWQSRIRNGQVTVNDRNAVPSHKLQAGDLIVAMPPDEIIQEKPEPELIPVTVLYVDDWFAIVEKAAGIVVHPGFGHESGTLVNALLSRFADRLSDAGGDHRPGIVHRLDKGTSGLLIVTLDNQAHARIARAFRERQVERYYDVIVRGTPDAEHGMIDLPIARAKVGRMKMEVRDDGKPSQTRFEIIASDDEFSHLKCQLITGRTHQIRVHLAYIGHPVVGDLLYGGRRMGSDTSDDQLLHASRLVFDHPITGMRVDVSSQLPERFQPFLQKFQNSGAHERRR